MENSTRLEQPFFQSALKFSNKIAIIHSKNSDLNLASTITYEKLSFEAEQISNILSCFSETKSQKGVVIHCSYGIQPIICILGCLKYGYYFYLCPTYTKAETQNLIYNLKFNLLLVENKLYNHIKYRLGNLICKEKIVTVLGQRFILVMLNFMSAKSPKPIIIESNECLELAYTISTSGSTGTPKIISVGHSCIVPNIKDFTRIYKIQSDDIILNCSPLTFDPSIIEIFLALSNGCQLVLFDRQILRQPKIFVDILMQSKASVIQLTPSFLLSINASIFNNYLYSPHCPLRVLSIGGEQFINVSLLKKYIGRKEIQVFNIYGVTEVSCWASIQKINLSLLEDDPLNLNKALNNFEKNKLKNDLFEIMDKTKKKRCENIFKDDVTTKECQASNCEHKNFINSIVNSEFLWDQPSSSNLDLSTEVCIGNALSNTTLYLVDDTGNIVNDGCGFICIGGERLNGVAVHGGVQTYSNLGCYNTGDIGYCKNGCVYFCGRYVNFIKRNGQRLSLMEVELVAYRSKVVDFCCAVFTKNNVILFVYVKVYNKSFEKLIRTYLNNNLIAWKLPDKIVFIGEIPFNKHGKVDKNKLFEVYYNRAILTNKKCKEFTIYNIKDLYKSILNVDFMPSSTDNFIELGGNSIMAVTLAETIKERLSASSVSLLDDILHKSLEYVYINANGNSDVESNVNKSDDYSSMVKINPNDGQKSRVFSITRRGITFNVNSNHQLRYPNCEHMQIKWRFDLDKCIDASPLLIENKSEYIYIGSHSHKFCCLDGDSGREIWCHKLGGRIEASANLSIDGNDVYVGCYDDNLYCLDTNTGDMRWMFTTKAEIKSSCAVDPSSGSIIFGCHDKNLYCLNVNGDLQWKIKVANGSIFSSPVISNGLVIVGTLNATLGCVALVSGMIVWKVTLGGPIFSSPAVYCKGVVVGCVDGSICSYSLEGVLLWTYKTKGPVFSSPFIIDASKYHYIAVGSHDMSVNILNFDGCLVQCIRFESVIYSSPFLFVSESELLNIVICESIGKLHLKTFNLKENELLPVNSEVLHFDGELFSSPVVNKNKIFIGCRDNFVYCIKFNK